MIFTEEAGLDTLGVEGLHQVAVDVPGQVLSHAPRRRPAHSRPVLAEVYPRLVLDGLGDNLAALVIVVVLIRPEVVQILVVTITVTVLTECIVCIVTKCGVIAQPHQNFPLSGRVPPRATASNGGSRRFPNHGEGLY